MPVRILPQNLVNQIAAGEVIERPASAIKELVENALDAGALKIEISTRNAGKSYISVSDDGCGMSREDLEKSVLRHATSKLPSDDLSVINFLGFRGEALPSIASVARVAITTNDGRECWKLEIDGGEVKKIAPAAGVKGTKVEVSDLFFNVPARLAFLKSDRGETSAIIDAAERIAMCRPDVAFTLDDLRFRPGLRIDRVCEVLGREFRENSVEINSMGRDIRVSGYVGRPTFAKGTTASQYFYVNGRALKDRLLLSSLRAAYMDVMEKGRHPCAALWLEMPPPDIDVNVHPQKAEVRFKEQGRVRALVISIVKAALSGAEVRPNVIDISGMVKAREPARDGVMEEAGRLFCPGFDGFGADPATIGGAAANDGMKARPLGAARGQLFNTYIIAQAEDGVVIADQHACHERIVYEALKREAAAGGVKRQIMLIPEVVELGARLSAALISVVPELENLGLAIEEFGPGAVIVREAPSAIGDADLQGLVRELAEEAGELGRADALEEKIAMAAKTFACHTSIRAGRAMSAEEMDALLRQVEESENAGQCNHGRRSYVKLSLKDLEKLFDR